MKRPAEDRIDDRTAEMNGFCICDIRHVFIGFYSFLPLGTFGFSTRFIN